MIHLFKKFKYFKDRRGHPPSGSCATDVSYELAKQGSVMEFLLVGPRGC